MKKFLVAALLFLPALLCAQYNWEYQHRWKGRLYDDFGYTRGLVYWMGESTIYAYGELILPQYDDIDYNPYTGYKRLRAVNLGNHWEGKLYHDAVPFWRQIQFTFTPSFDYQTAYIDIYYDDGWNPVFGGHLFGTLIRTDQ